MQEPRRPLSDAASRRARPAGFMSAMRDTAMLNYSFRAQGQARASSCGSTTPTGSAGSPSSRPAHRARPRLARPRAGIVRSASPTALAHYDTARDERLIAVRPALCLLRDAGGARVRSASRLLGAGRPPVYDRAALKLIGATNAGSSKASGRTPHWRFKLDAEQVAWDDLVRGRLACRRGEPERSGAGARRRPYLYTLAPRWSTISTSPITARDPRRGSRHQHRRADPDVPGAWRASPAFAHLPLLVDAAGGALSKRTRLAVARRSARGRVSSRWRIASYLATHRHRRSRSSR